MRAVVQVDKRTRRVIRRFKSANQACMVLGVSNANRICKDRQVGKKTWYLRYEDEFDPEEDFAGKYDCPVVAVDVSTGQETWFATTRSFAETVFMERESATSAIAKGSLVCGRYRVAHHGRRYE